MAALATSPGAALTLSLVLLGAAQESRFWSAHRALAHGALEHGAAALGGQLLDARLDAGADAAGCGALNALVADFGGGPRQQLDLQHFVHTTERGQPASGDTLQQLQLHRLLPHAGTSSCISFGGIGGGDHQLDAHGQGVAARWQQMYEPPANVQQFDPRVLAPFCGASVRRLP